MSNVTIVLNSSGIAELMSSTEITDYVESVANNCLGNVKGNYEVNICHSKDRNVANIKTADKPTYYRNLNGNELLKATRPNKSSR